MRYSRNWIALLVAVGAIAFIVWQDGAPERREQRQQRQLAQCQVVVGETWDALASCLIRLHDWDPVLATRAELHYVATLRSEQRAIQARRDSVATGQRRQEFARARREQLEYCRSLGVEPADCNTDGYLGRKAP